LVGSVSLKNIVSFLHGYDIYHRPHILAALISKKGCFMPKIFSGKGEILKEGKHFCSCTYNYRQSEDPRSGQTVIRGEITVDQKERLSIGILNNLPGSTVTLVEADERMLEISIVRAIGDILGGRYAFLPAPGNPPR
jgi:hypothetical protein